MTVFIIVLLITLGITLLLLEILVLPGITLAAIGGVVMMGAGIYLSYHQYGSTVGHFTVLGTLILSGSALVLVLKSKTWNRIKLDAEIDSKVDKLDESSVSVGDVGICISRLAPMGKIRVNKTVMEAKSQGTYIDEKTKVEVVGIMDKVVIVKPLNIN
jgi:membrane-bound ClpP family serine protease